MHWTACTVSFIIIMLHANWPWLKMIAPWMEDRGIILIKYKQNNVMLFECSIYLNHDLS